MKKTILSFDLDYDYIIVGISCHYKDYRLVFLINQNLGLHFVKQADHILNIKNSENQQFFSLFKDQDVQEEINFYLLNNRSEFGYLIPEYKQADYIFIAENTEESINEQLNYLGKIKNINGVLTAFNIDFELLKNKSNLIFE